MPRIRKNIFSKFFEQVGCVIQKRNTYFNLLYLSFSSCNSGDSHSNDSISNTENLKNFISEINFFDYEKNLYLFLFCTIFSSLWNIIKSRDAFGSISLNRKLNCMKLLSATTLARAACLLQRVRLSRFSAFVSKHWCSHNFYWFYYLSLKCCLML